MDNMMKGLFGGGSGDDDRQRRVEDFIQRYEQGPPDTGYDEEEAIQHLDQLIQHADAGQVERATRQALQRMPESERSQFADFVGQLQQRDRGGSRGSFGTDEIATMFGQAGGRAQSANDFFGSLFGGSMGGGMRGGGGMMGGGGGMGGLLGGLLGGGGMMGDDRSRGRDSGGLGGMLGSSAGKMLVGGIAAYLMKELMGGGRR